MALITNPEPRHVDVDNLQFLPGASQEVKGAALRSPWMAWAISKGVLRGNVAEITRDAVADLAAAEGKAFATGPVGRVYASLAKAAAEAVTAPATA